MFAAKARAVSVIDQTASTHSLRLASMAICLFPFETAAAVTKENAHATTSERSKGL